MTEPESKNCKDNLIHIFVTEQLKERIKKLAGKYEQSMSDMVRTLMIVGVPMMEEMNNAKDRLLKDVIKEAIDGREKRTRRTMED